MPNERNDMLNINEIDFPATSKISFFKIIEAVEEMAKGSNPYQAKHSRDLLEEVNQCPELIDGFTDLSLLTKYEETISRLAHTVFPYALLSNEIKGLTPPFHLHPFFSSTRFEGIIDNAGEGFQLELGDFNPDDFYRMGCATILSVHFGFPVSLRRPFVFRIPDKKNNTSKVYRIAFNADLIDLLPTEKSVDITEEDYHQLLDNYEDIDLWKEKFPPGSWVMKGVGMINLTDVTIDESISMITSHLLVKSNNTLEKITENLRVLYGISDLKVGFTAFEKNQFLEIHDKGGNSLLLKGSSGMMKCNEAICNWGLDQLVKEHKPFALSDVEKYHANSGNQFMKSLVENGIKSYVIFPLVHEGSLLGFLELASKIKYELNTTSGSRLSTILPVLSMAVARFREESKNRMEAVIQEECTSIHPSVKWRFEQEAKKYIVNQDQGEDAHFGDIVFKDIYPLYGQMDIKGSSTRRNKGVVADLVAQLKLVRKVLKAAYKIKNLHTYEELNFRVETYVVELRKGLLAGSEHKILDFLRSSVYPVFDHLGETNSELSNLVESYKAKLDPELGIIYNERRNFDESVMAVNQMMASFLDQKQEEVQQVFPHYFERYKTDGVDFNLYIGQSISERETFHHLYLHNLRLWQLLVMCEMENKFYHMQGELKTPLEAASLILVYSSSLSIHFRMDEKQFDIEGAYNARYEIIKKRVDKACIKGTTDRITVPGKVAIIYTSDQDRDEYVKYIHFLEEKGFVKQDSMEDHDLEDLQGITGLKALRIEVNYTKSPDDRESVSYDELIQSLQ